MFGKKKDKNNDVVVDATDNEVVTTEKTEEANAELVEEPKKERRNPFKDTGFIVKIFSAAVLLALGIWMIVDHTTAEKIIVTLSGCAILILCLARIVYLVRAKDLSKKYKATVLIEILLDFVDGMFLIVAGIYYQKNNNDEGDKKFVKFVRKNYRFFVGSAIYLRGVVHFFETGFLKSKTTIYNYFINIALITIGTFCLAYKFTVSKLVWVITVCVLLSFAYLAQDGIRQYVRFKTGGNTGEKKKEKKKDKDKPKENEIPAGILDEPTDRDQAIIN